MPTELARPLAALLTLSLAASPAPSQENRHFSDEDLAGLIEALSTYRGARLNSTGLDAARAGVSEALEDLSASFDSVDPLRFDRDLGRALWLARGVAGSEVRTGKVTTESLENGEHTFAYRTPKAYDPEGSTYPLIIAIPDEGEEPAEHLRANWMLDEVLDGAVLISPLMPAAQSEWTRVMVSGRPGGLSHVLTSLCVAGERFAIDFDRVYVAGRGKGVPAAIAAGNYAPHLFAGVIGRAGDAGEQGPENFSNLPTLFTGAGALATAFHEAVAEAELDNCELNPVGKEEEVWKWILDHPRTAHPASVTVVPGDPFPTHAYWLRIAPTASDARATAKIDRSANAILIEGEGVSQVTLYLSDALLDLDQLVLVDCNGVRNLVEVPRHLPTTLDLFAEGTSDPGRVYVSQLVFDMTGAAPAETSEDAAALDSEYLERLAAAGGDAAQLWALHEWCQANERLQHSKAILRGLVRVDPDHAAARLELGHVLSNAHWFSSQVALERYQKGQEEATAEARGRVLHKGLWVHPDERALVGKGWSKHPETGQWITPADRKRIDQGWVRQDLEWIAPADATRVDDGLWLVDGDWIELRAANRRRAGVDSMWHIPTAEVLVHATTDREVALRATHEMSRALEDLRRVFGAEPLLPLEVTLLRDEEQYDRFAFGAPDGRRPAAHAGRLHVIHSAFFAESSFRRVEGKLEYAGMGVSFWDPLVPYGDLYGVHSARLAVGLSYVEALDPSPKSVRKALRKGVAGDYYESFLAEKKLPLWLSYGGAVYAERFFRDSSTPADGDAWWARNWSLDNLEQRGGLRPLEECLAFELDPEDPEDGLKLLIEVGLVVAFVVDGECAEVDAAHVELKRALAAGRLHVSDVAALNEAIRAHETELRAFAQR